MLWTYHLTLCEVQDIACYFCCKIFNAGSVLPFLTRITIFFKKKILGIFKYILSYYMRLDVPTHARYGFLWLIATVALSFSPG